MILKKLNHNTQKMRVPAEAAFAGATGLIIASFRAVCKRKSARNSGEKLTEKRKDFTKERYAKENAKRRKNANEAEK